MDEFVKKRLEICANCPIVKMDSVWGPICDNKKYISPDGNDWSFFPKDGWKRGCGCKLRYRANSSSKHCIAGKW